MQIDMHFAGTWLMARFAEFSDQEARTIANSAQYIDDAAQTGFVRFDNGALFRRTATVNAMASPHNLNELDNHLAWLPFHFLPGDDSNSVKYADRLICRPKSEVAKAMVNACIAERNRPEGLHRLGITAHVFQDTFAHQGFAGMIHDVNFVKDIQSDDPVVDKDWKAQLEDLFDKSIGHIFHNKIPMLGHGMALTYPDLPWLTWQYTDGNDKVVKRDNLSLFTEALNELYRVFRCWRAVDAQDEVPGLDEKQKKLIVDHLSKICNPDAEKRLDHWLELIKEDAFGVGASDLQYEAKDWREMAIHRSEIFDSLTKDTLVEIPYPENFMESDWKRFHDAAKDHLHVVIQRILPARGLCVA